MQWGPRWSQSEGGPLAHALGAPSSQTKEAPSPMQWGPLVVAKRKAPSPTRWWPGWSQSEGGLHAHVVGASQVPKRRRPPRPCAALVVPKGGPHAHVVGASVVPK